MERTPLTAGQLYDFLTRRFEKNPAFRERVIAVEVREESEDEPEYGGDTSFVAAVWEFPDTDHQDLPGLDDASTLQFFVIEPDPMKQFEANMQMLIDRGHGEAVAQALGEMAEEPHGEDEALGEHLEES